MTRPIHTRRAARDAGMFKYYPGTPCRNGHDTLRYTASGACIACVAAQVRRRRGAGDTVMIRVSRRHADIVREIAEALDATVKDV